MGAATISLMLATASRTNALCSGMQWKPTSVDCTSMWSARRAASSPPARSLAKPRVFVRKAAYFCNASPKRDCRLSTVQRSKAARGKAAITSSERYSLTAIKDFTPNRAQSRTPPAVSSNLPTWPASPASLAWRSACTTRPSCASAWAMRRCSIWNRPRSWRRRRVAQYSRNRGFRRKVLSRPCCNSPSSAPRPAMRRRRSSSPSASAARVGVIHSNSDRSRSRFRSGSRRSRNRRSPSHSAVIRSAASCRTLTAWSLPAALMLRNMRSATGQPSVPFSNAAISRSDRPPLKKPSICSVEKRRSAALKDTPSPSSTLVKSKPAGASRIARAM